MIGAMAACVALGASVCALPYTAVLPQGAVRV